MTLPAANGRDAADRFPVTRNGEGRRAITPTDVSQFIRLDQCQRYLRLRLHERADGSRFMRDYGVARQAISPLLTKSGAAFEDAITAAMRTRYRVVTAAASGDRQPDNDHVLDLARSLAPGEVVIMTQPRLVVDLGDWRLRGDADIIRLERDRAGALSVLIVDAKSSTAAKIEHRLQVAFYDRMVATLFAAAGMPEVTIQTGILYRPGSDPRQSATAADLARIEREARQADELLGVQDGLLEIVAEPNVYRRSVADLVTKPGSVAERVSDEPFVALPYHLTFKCDGCLYNEFCMKWSAERDDLSLLPYIGEPEKAALQIAGVETIQELSRLKEPRRDPRTGQVDRNVLEPVAASRELVNRLGGTWPIGPRLDELIHRARSYRRSKGDPVEGLSYIPSKGYGSLPFVGPDLNPNLVRIYIDAQHDYLHDRLYLIGALVVGADGGKDDPDRRRVILEMADGPPETLDTERDLLVRWIEQTLRAVVEVAAPDANGLAQAPIHLIFYERYDQRVLLDALSRHAESILSATPLYDFMTQMAAFDSPVATFLSEEIKELKNYPMVSQSLQSVAKWLKFDWRQDRNYWSIFRERMFDYWGKLDDAGAADTPPPWYIKNARFSSQIPLEYAYATWGKLDLPEAGAADLYARYRAVSREQLLGFQQRRLEAIEWVAKDFRGNKDTTKGVFTLPDLADFEDKARNLRDALDEFMTIERHVSLSQWKNLRLQPPERRVLSGDTLVVRYLDADQAPGIAAWNRENGEQHELRQQLRDAWKETHPDAKQVRLPKDQREASDWSQDGLRLRLRIETAGVDASLKQIVDLTSMRVGDTVILNPRWTYDTRLPVAEQVPLQTTSRQMLYRSQLVRIVDIQLYGQAGPGFIEVELRDNAGRGEQGYVFAHLPQPLSDGESYTLDKDPSDWNGSHQRGVIRALTLESGHILFDRLRQAPDLPARAAWPQAAAQGQERFLAGLEALARADAIHPFAGPVREYIAGHGDTPVLLVQGPPGTGKSYTTAFALLARLQGARAAGIDCKILISCNTHSATDVLLQNIATVREMLSHFRTNHRAIFDEYFDPWLLQLPLYRIAPRPENALPPGVTPLYRKEEKPPGQRLIADEIAEARWAVAAGTPSAMRLIIIDKWSTKDLFGHAIADCMVLDEASRLSLPEAIMATLPLKPDGQLIVVGDHRQMPPIVQHDWATERRRSFQDYQTYESLFDTLRDRGVPGRPVYPMIQFAESFRLHADMAEFLRREVYRHDGIDYHSRRDQVLGDLVNDSEFVRAVLAPAYPLVVVVHDERRSQQRNLFEAGLSAEILRVLEQNGFDADTGLGVVVPHRAQRLILQDLVPDLNRRDPESNVIVSSAVDTVERYQGGERQVMIFSATESDPAYVLARSSFLLDPRRLTVALSRAKEKLILIAARSIFELFSPDEDTFANAQLWKNLLHDTCSVPLWSGELDGNRVEVWGNDPVLEPERLALLNARAARAD